MFEGKLRKVAKTNAGLTDSFTFAVTKVWKGMVSKTFTIYSYTHSCGLRTGTITKIGAMYLVYAKRGRAGVISLQCRRVAEFKYAQKDRKLLAAWAASRATSKPAIKLAKMPKGFAMSCRMQPSGKGILVFNFGSGGGQMISVLSAGRGAWGTGTSKLQGVVMAQDASTLTFRVPHRRGPLVDNKRASGTSYTLYWKGQQSQVKGGKHEGKLLLFSLPYPIPPNVRMAPKRAVCQLITFP